MAGYRFEISPVDPCATSSAGTLVKGATKAGGVAHDVVVNAGSDTTTVESAILLLTP